MIESRRKLVRLCLGWFAVGLAAGHATSAEPDLSKVPGVVIDHQPQSSGKYVGSPSIAVLPGGDYVASHDQFGPKSTEHRQAITKVFRSTDRGRSWEPISTIDGQFWSNLFVHREQLFIMGTYSHYGNVVIRRSTDGGRSWTDPVDEASGLLIEGRYHCAPMPMLIHNGRIWRAMEDIAGGGGWGKHFGSRMMSAPLEADLMRADSWTVSNRVGRDPAWLDGGFGGWLEGNAVATPEGRVVNILRVACDRGGKAAMISVSDDGQTATFDPVDGFIDFPGGSKKFTIRFDPTSRRYWSLANFVPPRHAGPGAASTRNTLALISSTDLRDWQVNCILLYHPDRARHGFQYPDWLFEGDDIIAVSRTAYDDGVGGARNAHDANFMTFHRIAGFRKLTPADSVISLDELQAPPKTTIETAELKIEGHRFAVATLDNDDLAYGNRPYVWKEVPQQFRGWRLTRTNGGEAPDIVVTAKRDTTIFIATAGQGGGALASWTPVDSGTFHYTDRGRTRMTVFRRTLQAGQQIPIPQGVWSGRIVLIPPAK